MSQAVTQPGALSSAGDVARDYPAASTPQRLWQHIPSPILGLFALDLLMGLANVGMSVVRRIFDTPDVRWFRLAEEANVPTWYSASQLALAGLILLLVAVRLMQRDRRAWSLSLAAALLLFLSMDEIAQFHETSGWLSGYISSRIGQTFNKTGAWVFVLLPLAFAITAGLALLTRRWWQGRPRVWGLYVAGFALLFGSAMGGELIENFLTPGSLLSHLEIFCEEVGEMLGGTVLVWASIELMRAHGMRLISQRPVAPLQP